MPPVICVLVTFPPGMEAEGFELSKGFQLKGFLKGTEVVPLIGGGIIGPDMVTIGVDPEGLDGLLTVGVTIGLGLGIVGLLGLPIIGIEVTTSREGGGKLGLVSIGTDPIGASCEMDVGVDEDISWCVVT